MNTSVKNIVMPVRKVGTKVGVAVTAVVTATAGVIELILTGGNYPWN